MRNHVESKLDDGALIFVWLKSIYANFFFRQMFVVVLSIFWYYPPISTVFSINKSPAHRDLYTNLWGVIFLWFSRNSPDPLFFLVLNGNLRKTMNTVTRIDFWVRDTWFPHSTKAWNNVTFEHGFNMLFVIRFTTLSPIFLDCRVYTYTNFVVVIVCRRISIAEILWTIVLFDVIVVFTKLFEY